MESAAPYRTPAGLHGALGFVSASLGGCSYQDLRTTPDHQVVRWPNAVAGSCISRSSLCCSAEVTRASSLAARTASAANRMSSAAERSAFVTSRACSEEARISLRRAGMLGDHPQCLGITSTCFGIDANALCRLTATLGARLGRRVLYAPALRGIAPSSALTRSRSPSLRFSLRVSPSGFGMSLDNERMQCRHTPPVSRSGHPCRRDPARIWARRAPAERQAWSGAVRPARLMSAGSGPRRSA